MKNVRRPFVVLYRRVLGYQYSNVSFFLSLFEDETYDTMTMADRDAVREQLLAEVWGLADPV